MATIPTKPVSEVAKNPPDPGVPVWPQWHHEPPPSRTNFQRDTAGEESRLRPFGGDALQALLAFSALHQHVRRRRALASNRGGFEIISEFDPAELFVLDDVLQLVAERAIAITGADGLGIALAENTEIVLRASAGRIKPDVGARIERDSAFSGACFRSAQIIRCDDTETDDRVNVDACRKLGARSMVAVPLCGRRRVIGLLEAFSAEPFGFNDSDVSSLELLAEVILGALKPEDEDRFAEAAQVAELELAPGPVVSPPVATPTATAVTKNVAAEIQPFIATGTTEPQVVETQPAEIQPELPSQPAKLQPAQSQSEDFTTPTLQPATKDEFRNDVPSLMAVGTQLTAASSAEAERFPDDVFEVQPDQPVADRHPGILLVLVLVVACALLALGLWWKLKNSQLDGVLVKPEQHMSRPAGESAPVPVTPSASPQSSAPEIVTGVPIQGVPLPGVNDRQNSVAGSASGTTASADVAGANGSARASGQLPRITGIRHWSAADSSTVVLDLEDQVQYEEHRLANPDRIYFDLHDTALAPDLEGKTIEIGDALLNRVRVAQPVAGLTRVVLETKGSNSSFSVSLEPNPYRLVVQVRKPGAKTTAEVSLFPQTAETARDKLAIVVPPPTKEDLQLRARVPKMRIVVDAGHGGWDLGTVGRKGLLEKDVVLEIAQRLAKLLETRLGAEVILTRNDDTYIPLDERAGLANQSQADLFISVHANYSDLPSARGVETYYTNFFSSPNAKDVDTRIGAPGAKTLSSATLSAADLHDRIEQSRRLAASVQRSLYGTLSVQNPGLRDRGVKEASYVVLTETAMPGILAEVSFVSSPADEQRLRSDGYREQIAEALYKGIAHYAAVARSVKMAAR